jgi:hypothetical protein
MDWIPASLPNLTATVQHLFEASGDSPTFSNFFQCACKLGPPTLPWRKAHFDLGYPGRRGVVRNVVTIGRHGRDRGSGVYSNPLVLRALMKTR